MDTQHLQMILDTVKSIAGTAGTVGMVWVLIHYLTMIIQILAWPMALAVTIIAMVRGWISYSGRVAPPSGDMLEKTKQAEISANAEIAKHACTQQLFALAKAAGVEPSRYSGVDDRSLANMTNLLSAARVAKAAQP